MDSSVDRASALSGHYVKGHYGAQGTGVVIAEVPDLVLWQLAVWPDTLASAGSHLAHALNVAQLPGFGCAASSGVVALLRVEPLKFWVVGSAVDASVATESVSLDLSHSRTQLRISGPHSRELLNSYLPLDLRDASFPINSVASTAFHHVGITLWRSPLGFELFLPRSYALSLWELLQQSAMQYGLLIE